MNTKHEAIARVIANQVIAETVVVAGINARTNTDLDADFLANVYTVAQAVIGGIPNPQIVNAASSQARETLLAIKELHMEINS